MIRIKTILWFVLLLLLLVFGVPRIFRIWNQAGNGSKPDNGAEFGAELKKSVEDMKNAETQVEHIRKKMKMPKNAPEGQ